MTKQSACKNCLHWKADKPVEDHLEWKRKGKRQVWGDCSGHMPSVSYKVRREDRDTCWRFQLPGEAE